MKSLASIALLLRRFGVGLEKAIIGNRNELVSGIFKIIAVGISFFIALICFVAAFQAGGSSGGRVVSIVAGLVFLLGPIIWLLRNRAPPW